MSKLSDEQEAEFRASGWSDAEIRDYKRGYESVPEPRSWVPAAPAPKPPPEYIQGAQHFPRNSERGRWQRETFAGALSRLLPPVDDAAELEEARQLREHREYAYETEAPPLAVFRVAVRHSGPRGVTITGTTAEVAQTFRTAGIPIGIAETYEPPATSGPVQVQRV